LLNSTEMEQITMKIIWMYKRDLLKEDGRHKAVLTIIVIRSLPLKQFVQKGFKWKHNGTHKVLKRIIVIRLFIIQRND